MAGKPKLGKSWLALNLAVAVASGGIALGKIEVEAGDVLYLALEDTRRRLQSRLRKILAADAAPERLTLATKWQTQDDGGTDDILKWLNAHPSARLVIVDVWTRFRRPPQRGANEYREDYEAAGRLKEIADAASVAIIAVTHCRKMRADDVVDEITGTLGVSGAADATLIMRRCRGHQDAELHITGRDVEEQALAVRFDPQFGTWQIIGEASETSTPEREAILSVLRTAAKPLQPKELAEALGKTRVSVSKILGKMLNAGQVALPAYGLCALPSLSEGTPVTPITLPYPPSEEEYNPFPKQSAGEWPKRPK